jgi:hypothetical protein
MIFRSLSNDQRTVGIGEALKLFFGEIRLIRVVESGRIECIDLKTDEHFSLEGSPREIAVLKMMYDLTGPMIALSLLYQIDPRKMPDLFDRKRNPKAYRQGAMHALHLHNVETPDEKAFLRWLGQLSELP